MNAAGGQKIVRFRINGRVVDIAAGKTILDAAKEIGISIPALCNHPMLSHSGSCRVCIVEVNGNPMTACTTLVDEDMEIVTNSPYIENLRKDTIDLILSDHPFDCMVCQKTGECELQELAYTYTIRQPIFSGERRTYEKKPGCAESWAKSDDRQLHQGFGEHHLPAGHLRQPWLASFGPNKRQGSDAARLSQIQDGRWRVVSEYVKP